MPFTAAHPAAILPLLRRSRWFSATGLVVGSIAPDFEYFLLLPLFKHSGHTLEGILFFNLPVALVIASVFHLLVRRPAITYLPLWLKQRALAVPELDWLLYLKKNGHVFAYSVAIGAASHIFWDSFTHESGYLVQRWPVLESMVSVMGFEIMVCRMVQHSSTVIGALLILVYTWRQPKVAIPDKVNPTRKTIFWLGIGIAGIAFMGYALYASTFMRSPMGIVVSFMTGSMLATIAASTFLRLSWAKGR